MMTIPKLFAFEHTLPQPTPCIAMTALLYASNCDQFLLSATKLKITLPTNASNITLSCELNTLREANSLRKLSYFLEKSNLYLTYNDSFVDFLNRTGFCLCGLF